MYHIGDKVKFKTYPIKNYKSSKELLPLEKIGTIKGVVRRPYYEICYRIKGEKSLIGYSQVVGRV